MVFVYGSMTHERAFELWYDYQYGPNVVYRRILWVHANVDAVVEWGRRCGQRPTFWTWTFANADSEAQNRKDVSKALKRLLVKIPDLCGVRVNQYGTRKGRFHTHLVLDREVPLPKMKECLRGTTLTKQPDVELVRDDGVGGYLARDMSKGFRKKQQGRHFSVFGLFEGKMRLADIVIHQGEFWECQAMARAERVTGENWRRAWERGWKYYLQRTCAKCGGNWSDWFWEAEWRAMAGISVERGDAYEDEDVAVGAGDFDLKELEST